MVFQFSNVANTGQYVHFTIYWYQGCLVCDILVGKGFTNMLVHATQTQDIWPISNVPCPSLISN